MWRLLFLLFRIPVFSIASGAVVALNATSGTVFFPIDSSLRGTDIINTFYQFTVASGTTTPQLALQTTLVNLPKPPNSTIPYATYKNIKNGIVPYVQSITSTTHNTLLIIKYLSQQLPSTPQYIVLPSEQVLDLLYFSTNNHLPTNSNPFVAPAIAGTVPYYSVDPRQRASDIGSAITKLLSSPFKTSTSQVWVEVTLTGPFNPALPVVSDGSNTNSLLKNVTGVTVTNNLIIFSFLPPNQTDPPTVIVTPEQVQQIIYVLNLNTP